LAACSVDDGFQPPNAGGAAGAGVSTASTGGASSTITTSGSGGAGGLGTTGSGGAAGTGLGGAGNGGGGAGGTDVDGSAGSAGAVDAGVEACAPPDASSQTYYVSDLNWQASINGWGPVERDTSNGENLAGDGHPISIDGMTYAKGLGVHAYSLVTINLAGRCSTFTASAGMDDEQSGGTAVFEVWVDGVSTYTSLIKQQGQPPDIVTVDVSCAMTLQLVVSDAGDGINHDHADWADAKINCISPPSDGIYEAGSPVDAGPQPDVSTQSDASSPDASCLADDGRALQSFFLSDVNWVGTPTNGWGPVERDTSNGEQAAGDGHVMSINGVTFAKGLGVHANSTIEYALAGKCSTFTASVGHDDETSPGSVVFEVWLDGTRYYQSSVQRPAQPAESVSLDVSCVNKLQLVVTDAGDGANNDHADWANAKITCTDPPGGLVDAGGD
jgi:hypothetical protein